MRWIQDPYHHGYGVTVAEFPDPPSAGFAIRF